MLGLLFWRGCPPPGQTRGKVQGKATGIGQSSGPSTAKPAVIRKMMENQVSPIHHGWARAGAGLWARESIGTTLLFLDTFRHNDAVYHISFLLPDLSAGFMGRLFIKPSLVHRDLIRYSLNITRRINYHCCTRATEEVKCFSFAWIESICLKCSQYH